MIEYDPEKDRQNVALRGISFACAADFEWDTARVGPDQRRDYGEPRYTAVGYIYGRLHVLVFTPRNGQVRVISLRKANKREEAAYAKTT